MGERRQGRGGRLPTVRTSVNPSSERSGRAARVCRKTTAATGRPCCRAWSTRPRLARASTLVESTTVVSARDRRAGMSKFCRETASGVADWSPALPLTCSPSSSRQTTQGRGNIAANRDLPEQPGPTGTTRVPGSNRSWPGGARGLRRRYGRRSGRGSRSCQPGTPGPSSSTRWPSANRWLIQAGCVVRALPRCQ